MRFIHRLIRHRFAVAALAAVCVPALAVPAGARTSEPAAGYPKSDIVLSGTRTVTTKVGTLKPPQWPTNPVSLSSPSGSGGSGADISVLAFLLSLGGASLIAAGGAAAVTARVQRQRHSVA